MPHGAVPDPPRGPTADANDFRGETLKVGSCHTKPAVQAAQPHDVIQHNSTVKKVLKTYHSKTRPSTIG